MTDSKISSDLTCRLPSFVSQHSMLRLFVVEALPSDTDTSVREQVPYGFLAELSIARDRSERRT